MTTESQNHLLKGLRLLSDRLVEGPVKWIRAGENWLDKLIRFVMVGGPGYLAWRVLTSSWVLLGLAALIVVVLALRAATKAANGEPAKQPAPPPGPSPGEPEKPAVDGLPHVPREQFLNLVHNALGAAKGVHLRTLTVPLTKHYGGAWEAADVRALCDAYGVPTRPTVRAPGGGPTVGIHRADFEALPRPLPEGVPVADVADYTAGQRATTSATTPDPTTSTTVTDRQFGDWLVVTADDPVRPERASTKLIDRTRKRA